MTCAHAIAWIAVLLIGACTATPAICQVKHARIENVELAYVEAGSGDPIVFVHGGLQDYRLWEAHLPAFSGKYRAIAYSRRNHYPNTTSIDAAPDNAADLHAEDLAAFIKALGLPRVHVVAHSAGAHAALFFAANHPEMVLTLIINEPPASGLLMSSAEGRAILADFNARLAPSREEFRAGNMPNAVRLFADEVGGSGTYDHRPEAARQMMLDNALAHAADATSARPRPVLTCETAQRITMPTLITQGTRSPSYFAAVVDELERCLPNRERLQIDASHSVPMENPRDFDAAVLAFLSKQPNTIPLVSEALPPPGTEGLAVRWARVTVPGLGVLPIAVARPSGAGPFPTIVLLHGSHGFAQEYVQLALALARKGQLAVAACWFTAGSGAGSRFVTPIACPQAPAMSSPLSDVAQKTVAALAQAARALPDAAAGPIALFGHSRGGGAALKFVMQTGNARAAILNSTGYPAEVSNSVSQMDVPILILHGTADSPADGGSSYTSVAMARNFEAALRTAGNPVEAVYYEAGRHNGIFDNTTQFDDEVHRIVTFLERKALQQSGR